MVKNKLAPPFREVEFDIMFGEGISKEGDVLDLATEAAIIEKSGAWFSFEGERIGQGRENAKDYLREHPAIADKMERAVLAKHGIARAGDAPLVEGTPANGATDKAPSKKKGTEQPRA